MKSQTSSTSPARQPDRSCCRVTFGRSPSLVAGIFVVLTSLLMLGCPTKLVQVRVQAEDIIRANEAAKEADLAFIRRDHYAALIKYLEAARHNPNSEYIYNKLGISYSQLRYYPEAVAAFQRSIALNPKYPYSYNNLGSVYFALDDKRKAEKSFRKAISLNPNVASFHVNLGTLYFEKKQFEKGKEEWRQGLGIDPTILSKSEGISLVAAGTRSSPSEKNYYMARLFASMGNAAQAVQSLQQALNAGFTNIEAIRREPDFDPIREDEQFREFMRTAALLTKPAS